MRFLLITSSFFLLQAGFAQVLLDDVNSHYDYDSWSILIDTLRNHGVQVFPLSDRGWQMLDSVNVLWIEGPEYFYPDSVKEKIVSFSRRGGKIFFGIDAHTVCAGGNYARTLGDLFSYDNFKVNIELCIKGPPHPEEGFEGYFIPLGPFTNGIDSLRFWISWELRLLGDNTIPFIFMEPFIIVGAISFPFKDEGDCENYVIIFTDMHKFETPSIIRERFSLPRGNWKLITNIFQTLVANYSFNVPCDSIPFIGITDSLTERRYSCLSLPSPFTPNGDGINDFCQFTFPDMMFSPAVIRIYDIHSVLVKDIQVPLGWAAKSAARWYGKDNSGKPVPQGVYLYEIEQNGEVICTGTVTVAR